MSYFLAMVHTSLLVSKTVVALSTIIDRNNVRALPSMQHLSRELAVSIRTIRAAVNELVVQGKVTCSQGKRVLVINSPKKPALSNNSAASDLLYSLILARIQAGDYRTNEPLPKSAYFSLKEHVSPNTISLALTRLCRENLIYKKGKRWFAGQPQPAKDTLLRHSERRMVLLITPPSWEMRNLLMSGFLTPFSNPLVHELQRHDIQLQLVFLKKAGYYTTLMKGRIRRALTRLGRLSSLRAKTIWGHCSIADRVYRKTHLQSFALL